MIDNIESTRAFLASLGFAVYGEVLNYYPLITLDSANTFFQHLVWVIAILAGIVSIVNGVKKWFVKEPKINKKEDEG